MAGSAPATDATAPDSPHQPPFAQDVLDSINAVAQPGVEMQPMSSHTPPTVADPPIDQLDGLHATNEAAEQEGTGASTPQADAISGPNPTQPLSRPGTGNPQPVEDGIGPATDKPHLQLRSSPEGMQLVITLLLHSTDTRHPYIIDEAYLQRRNIEVEDGDPANMSAYTLKELIMRDWRPEWEAKPASPSSIRLIHMGRMLEDKWYLKDARFACGPNPHIVHMTIKPQEVVDEEDARIAKGGREGGRIGGGCRCVVM